MKNGLTAQKPMHLCVLAGTSDSKNPDPYYYISEWKPFYYILLLDLIPLFLYVIYFQKKKQIFTDYQCLSFSNVVFAVFK